MHRYFQEVLKKQHFKPNTMNYQGYYIHPDLTIWKDGKKWFTAWHQRCSTLDECKIMIDASEMAKEMFNKFPNLSKIDLAEIIEDENGTEKDHESMSWCNQQAEQELFNHENNY